MPKKPTPLQAIRRHCIECSGGSKDNAKYCTMTRCALYPYREGRDEDET